MKFEDSLKHMLENSAPEVLAGFLKENISNLFSTPFLRKYYLEVKDMCPEDHEALTILAWMAMLSGDNLHMHGIVKKIDYSKLDRNYGSLFKSLAGLSSVFGDNASRLKYSEEAISLLNGGAASVFRANAWLTHGQILAGNFRIRESVEYFLKAYEDFMNCGMQFPASVSLTNALLKLFMLGETENAISRAKSALVAASVFKSDGCDYRDIICLPLGMCYYAQSKISLALDYLQRAKKAIDSMDLIHMHGALEIYIMKTLAVMKDFESLKNYLEETKELFGGMNYPLMQVILIYGNMLRGGKISRLDKERLGTIHSENGPSYPLLDEMLSYLSNIGEDDSYTLDCAVRNIERHRFSGDLVSLQTSLILLADRYFRNGEIKESKTILEETLKYRDENRLEADFRLYEYEFWPLLEKMNASVSKPESGYEYHNPLTSKETDILKLISLGLSNREIGERLFISVGTVKWHINHILSKLDAKNRFKAAEKAKAMNVI